MTVALAAAQTRPPAWEDRERLGFFPALWSTWTESVFRPVPFFRSLPTGSARGSALSYYVLVAAVGLFFRVYWVSLESALSGGLNAPLAGEVGLELTGGQAIALFVVSALFLFLFLLLLYVGLLFVTAAVVHAGFAVAGAAQRGFEATLRGLAYSSGPVAFLVFPFFGPTLSLVWWTVLTFIALREVHRTTNGRATLGFALPLIALTILLVFVGFLAALLVSSAGVGSL